MGYLENEKSVGMSTYYWANGKKRTGMYKDGLIYGLGIRMFPDREFRLGYEYETKHNPFEIRG